MRLCKGEKVVDEVTEPMLIARRLITKCLPFNVSRTVQCQYLG